MELERQHEHVGFFHYDARNFEFERQYGTPETRINVQFTILEDEDIADTDTGVSCAISSIVVLDDYVLSSNLDQVTLVKGEKYATREDLPEALMQEIAEPLLDLEKRLTYEVTEVATDQPGLKLEF